MAEFICRLGTPAGEVVTRTIEAPGVNEARARLEREGFRVFNVTPPKTTGVTALNPTWRPRRSAAKSKPTTSCFSISNSRRWFAPVFQFCRRSRCCVSAQPRRACARCSAKLRIRFAAARRCRRRLPSQGSIFPRIYTASILAGERSGALDEVLNRYVTYMRRNVALRRKIRGALAYPLFLLFASGVHGDVSDGVCRAANVGSVFRIWHRAADGHADRGWPFKLAVVKRDLVWTTVHRRRGRLVSLVAHRGRSNEG